LALLTDPELGITHLCGVLQMYEWVTALPGFGAATFPSLRTVLFGGWGPSAAGIYRAWAERGIWVQLSYGASEIGPNVSILSEADLSASERGTSGPILPHTAVRIVDADGSEVATGETGEIWVRGPGVTPGYWRQPRGEVFSGEWFRTGDAARIDEAGHLYVVGRIREVYRSGGENVYPAEVEAVLAQLPGVRELAVLGVPDEKWGESGLVALVPEAGVSVTLEQIRGFAEGKLARFKLPAALIVLDELPRSATDKIARPQIRELWERTAPTPDGAWAATPCTVHD
jgi:fatty-acyl-CoA synthase